MKMMRDEAHRVLQLARLNSNTFQHYVRGVLPARDEMGMSGVHQELSELDYLQRVANVEQYVPKHQDLIEKNRYTNVFCGCDTRVVLNMVEEDPNSTYINANYMKSDLRGSDQEYITTQAPLRNTSGDFWRMNWENQTSVIIMLTKFEESGRLKADPYWSDGQIVGFPTDGLSVEAEILDQFGDTILRRFRIYHHTTKTYRDIHHIHYVGWPDFGVPKEFSSYLAMFELYRELRELSSGPIVAHCSAGLGRTGTFLAIDIVLDYLEKCKNEEMPNPVINIMEVVYELRLQRPGSIQTKEQYMFVYDFINFCLQEHLFGA